MNQYTYPFKIFAPDQVAITVVNPYTANVTPIYLTTDYTVSGVGADSGGTVTLTASGVAKAGTGNNLVLLRSMPFTQTVDYRPHDVFPAETHERALDILTMQCQQLLEMVGRAVLNPDGATIEYEEFLSMLNETNAALTQVLTALDSVTTLSRTLQYLLVAVILVSPSQTEMLRKLFVRLMQLALHKPESHHTVLMERAV